MKKLWRMAGGSALSAGAVTLGSDQIADFGRFLQILLLPSFDDPDLAARVLGTTFAVVAGLAVGIAKTLLSKEI